MAKSNELPKDDLYKLRHSAAHVMAEAVVERYPEARVAIGPPIEEGFYYDFDLGRNADGSVRTFAPDDLEWIEGRMRQIIGGRFPFEYREVSAAEAKALFRTPSHPYTRMLFDAVPDLAMSGREHRQVEGEIPNPVNPPSGCTFHPRCPHADTRCRTEVPLPIEKNGALVACHAREEGRI